MILDTLKNSHAYLPLHPRFKTVFQWLNEQNLAALPDGRQAIDGEQIYALVMVVEGKGQELAKLEAHRQYIDIQISVTGDELIGWSAIDDPRCQGAGYDQEKDLEFFTGMPAVWTRVPEGAFAIYCPHDLHAPCAGKGTVKKVVVKIAL